MYLLITCLFFVLIAAYLRLAPWLWVLMIAAPFIISAYFSLASVFTLIVIGSFFTLIILFALTPLRRKLISARLFKLYKKLLPKMSSTEREALEAGTVWWDAELFSGKPDWKKLRSLPKPELKQEEQDFLDGPVEEVCNMLDDWEITNKDQDLPDEVWEFLKQKHFSP